MNYTIPSKPTIYKNTQFRSRLEARWAAFFDLIGWRWQYEPYDLKGWTPDFIVYGSENRYILFEVKPYIDKDVLKECNDKSKKSKTLNFYPNCILLDNNFNECPSDGGLLAGFMLSPIEIHEGTLFFESEYRVHWKNNQQGDNSSYDIGSLEMAYDGLLWQDNRNRKDFICHGFDDGEIKSLWVKAGVLSSFHYE